MPLVSVIIPTKNSGATLEQCLRSIADQSYKNIEIIVVDNSSTDNTLEIAKKYTNKVFTKGPERSAQRNFGASEATGDFWVFIDSDMEPSRDVIAQCVDKCVNDIKIDGVVIPEESFGEGFWAKCKRLERSYYVGISWMEAARFFRCESFENVEGYNEKMVSGEDWDLSQRVESEGKLSRIDAMIRHNEGRIGLIKTMKKKYYYAKEFKSYLDGNKETANVASQTSPLKRYALFLSQPAKLFRNPLVWVGMLFMKTCEFGAGALAIKFT